MLLIDEAGKWEETDISEYLQVALKIIRAGKQTGRIIMITTVNKGDKGGDNYKIVWDQSDQTKLDVLGQTKSKLYRLFIEGYRGMDGWIDRYGNSVINTPTKEQTEWLKEDPNCLNPYIGSKEFCDIQRANLEDDPEAYMEEVRMVPYNPKEVFESANNQCHFNLKDLNSQIQFVKDLISEQGRNPEKDDNGRKGAWRKLPNNSITWEDDKKDGMWYILEFLDEKDSCRKGCKDGINFPDNTSYGVAGLDTYSHSKNTVEKGSDSCLIVFKRYNPLNPDNSGMPVAMFIGRPKTKDDFHKQVYMGLEYYGIRMLAERSPTDWEDWAIREHLASENDAKKKVGYLVTTVRSMNNTEVYGMNPQDAQGRETHLTKMVEYALNNMHKILFLRLLKDMLKFNVKERTVFDACMAFGYALIALDDSYKQIVPKERSTPLIRTFKLKTA